MENPAILNNVIATKKGSYSPGSPDFAGRDKFGQDSSTRGGTASLANSQNLAGIGALAGLNNAGGRRVTLLKQGTSSMSEMGLGSRMDTQESQSHALSSDEEEEHDPNKLYTPVTTILMSFDVKKQGPKQTGAEEEDRKLMTIIESEETSAVHSQNNQSQIITKSLKNLDEARIAKQPSQSFKQVQNANQDSFF